MAEFAALDRGPVDRRLVGAPPHPALRVEAQVERHGADDQLGRLADHPAEFGEIAAHRVQQLKRHVQLAAVGQRRTGKHKDVGMAAGVTDEPARSPLDLGQLKFANAQLRKPVGVGVDVRALLLTQVGRQQLPHQLDRPA